MRTILDLVLNQALQDFDEVVGPIAPEKRANILGLNIAKLLDIAMP